MTDDYTDTPDSEASDQQSDGPPPSELRKKSAPSYPYEELDEAIGKAEKPAPDGDAEETARAKIAEARRAHTIIDPETAFNDEPDEAASSMGVDTKGEADVNQQTIDEIIEAAVGVSMEAFERRHPTTARYLKRHLGDPLEFTVKVLQEDALYQQLIADTEKALDIAAVVKVIVSVALRVAERFLVGM